jgi:hypothetical protein
MAYQKSSVSDFGRGKSLSGFEYCHQHSTIPGDVPAAAELKPGELAVNSSSFDGKVFYKNASGVVKSIPSGFTGDIAVSDPGGGDDQLLTFSAGLLVSKTNT